MTELGWKIFRMDEVDSTNSFAKELITQSVEEGCLVISDIQTGGKGRMDRKWESPKGGLWLSIILKPKGELVGDRLGIIPLMSGCAAARAIEAISGLTTRVKWPNDVIINENKISGILSESIVHNRERWVIVGIGINVNNEVQDGYEFNRSPTSIIEETGNNTDLRTLEVQLICEMERFYNMAQSGKAKGVLDEWRQMADTLGRNVIINRIGDEIIGKAVDIDENGALVLELEDGSLEVIMAGDCQHLE
ncbi:MAG: biotin--[acetyl-CoA-carboxylase] ligase [Thermoplasmata archaeon]|nr:biotin--[acetyl-CoA-carboxylase] ligase [Thermoplasmata archaeon]